MQNDGSVVRKQCSFTRSCVLVYVNATVLMVRRLIFLWAGSLSTMTFHEWFVLSLLWQFGIVLTGM